MAHSISMSGAGGLCPVTVADRELLAITGDDGQVEIWDPETDRRRGTRCSAASSLCRVTVASRYLFASTFRGDRIVRIWDPETGKQHTALEGHLGGVNDVCEVTIEGRHLVASGGDDRTARIWDPETGACLLTIPTHHPVVTVTWVAGVLVIVLDEGILAIRPSLA
jgi:WD40 repeat protein